MLVSPARAPSALGRPRGSCINDDCGVFDGVCRRPTELLLSHPLLRVEGDGERRRGFRLPADGLRTRPPETAQALLSSAHIVQWHDHGATPAPPAVMARSR